MSTDHISKSKFLSYVLRHRPESIGLHLDSEGWANIQELLTCASKHGRRFDATVLKEIVATDNKRRYAISEDGINIRAQQGHSSLAVKLTYPSLKPPSVLYHGTATRFLESIFDKGLLPGTRHYVHLSEDKTTAISVGKRHGKPIILAVDANAMWEDGFSFHQAENNVWLINSVPTKYLNRL